MTRTIKTTCPYCGNMNKQETTIANNWSVTEIWTCDVEESPGCDKPYVVKTDVVLTPTVFQILENAGHGEIFKALKNLVNRCNGTDGIKADGSNIDTSFETAILKKAGAFNHE